MLHDQLEVRSRAALAVDEPARRPARVLDHDRLAREVPTPVRRLDRVPVDPQNPARWDLDRDLVARAVAEVCGELLEDDGPALTDEGLDVVPGVAPGDR